MIVSNHFEVIDPLDLMPLKDYLNKIVTYSTKHLERAIEAADENYNDTTWDPKEVGKIQHPHALRFIESLNLEPKYYEYFVTRRRLLGIYNGITYPTCIPIASYEGVELYPAIFALNDLAKGEGFSEWSLIQNHMFTIYRYDLYSDVERVSLNICSSPAICVYNWEDIPLSLSCRGSFCGIDFFNNLLLMPKPNSKDEYHESPYYPLTKLCIGYDGKDFVRFNEGGLEYIMDTLGDHCDIYDREDYCDNCGRHFDDCVC